MILVLFAMPSAAVELDRHTANSHFIRVLRYRHRILIEGTFRRGDQGSDFSEWSRIKSRPRQARALGIGLVF